MKWDVIIFNSECLWENNGIPNFYNISQLCHACNMNDISRQIINKIFPDKVDFKGKFILCEEMELDPIEIYKAAAHFEFEIAIVPTGWREINMEEVITYLASIEFVEDED